MPGSHILAPALAQLEVHDARVFVNLHMDGILYMYNSQRQSLFSG